MLHEEVVLRMCFRKTTCKVTIVVHLFSEREWRTATAILINQWSELVYTASVCLEPELWLHQKLRWFMWVPCSGIWSYKMSSTDLEITWASSAEQRHHRIVWRIAWIVGHLKFLSVIWLLFSHSTNHCIARSVSITCWTWVFWKCERASRMLEFQRLNYIEKVGRKVKRNQTGMIVQQTEVCATNTKREVSHTRTHTGYNHTPYHYGFTHSLPACLFLLVHSVLSMKERKMPALLHLTF